MENKEDLRKSQISQFVQSADSYLGTMKEKVMTSSLQIFSKIDDSYNISERASEWKKTITGIKTPSYDDVKTKLAALPYDIKDYLNSKGTSEQLSHWKETITSDDRIQRLIEYIDPIISRVRTRFGTVEGKGDQDESIEAYEEIQYHHLLRKNEIIDPAAKRFFAGKKPNRRLPIIKNSRFLWINDGILYVLAQDFRSRYYVKSQVPLRNLLKLGESEDKPEVIMEFYDETEETKDKVKVKRYEMENLAGFLTVLKRSLERFRTL